jgi:acyl-CoA thioester hydrolase
MMGHVNNAVYFTYCEQGRLTWWRSLGSGPGIAGVTTNIVLAECDYRAPARVHDELEVRVLLRALGRTSVTLAYEIRNVATDRLLAEGVSVNVTLDPQTLRPMPIPDDTRRLLSGQATPV